MCNDSSKNTSGCHRRSLQVVPLVSWGTRCTDCCLDGWLGGLGVSVCYAGWLLFILTVHLSSKQTRLRYKQRTLQWCAQFSAFLIWLNIIKYCKVWFPYLTAAYVKRAATELPFNQRLLSTTRLEEPEMWEVLSPHSVAFSCDHLKIIQPTNRELEERHLFANWFLKIHT